MPTKRRYPPKRCACNVFGNGSINYGGYLKWISFFARFAGWQKQKWMPKGHPSKYFIVVNNLQCMHAHLITCGKQWAKLGAVEINYRVLSIVVGEAG